MASQDAGSLRCPHCGAAADPASQRCGYCKARLATVSCPGCLGLIFEGSDYCPRCGARRSRIEYPADAACPACREKMTEVAVGELSILECGACDAVWVAAAAFERLCTDREAQAAVLHNRAPDARKLDIKVRYRPCPHCKTMMNRVNFAQLSGVVVDVCKGHGTFLDRGELQAVVEFIAGGGLERARQRKIDDMKEQEQKLRDMEMRVRMARGDHSSGGVKWTGSTSALDFGSIVDLFSSD